MNKEKIKKEVWNEMVEWIELVEKMKIPISYFCKIVEKATDLAIEKAFAVKDKEIEELKKKWCER